MSDIIEWSIFNRVKEINGEQVKYNLFGEIKAIGEEEVERTFWRRNPEWVPEYYDKVIVLNSEKQK